MVQLLLLSLMQKRKIQMWWIRNFNKPTKKIHCKQRINLDMEFNKIICVHSLKRYKSMFNLKWLHFAVKWPILQRKHTFQDPKGQISDYFECCKMSCSFFLSCRYNTHSFYNWFISDEILFCSLAKEKWPNEKSRIANRMLSRRKYNCCRERKKERKRN